ncbi:MAG: hypothetical protein FWG21_00660 [Oscillospiraceae bacterium]|nr:hypothetical protein [Oscillospiraceae bacterium]
MRKISIILLVSVLLFCLTFCDTSSEKKNNSAVEEGYNCLDRQDYSNAKTLFEQALSVDGENNPTDIYAMEGMIKALSGLGEIDAAMDYYYIMTELNSDNDELQSLLNHILQAAVSSNENPINIAVYALERYPEDENILLTYISLLKDAKEYRKVIKIYEDFLSEDISDTKRYYALTEQYISMSMYEEAFEFILNNNEFYSENTIGKQQLEVVMQNLTIEWKEPLLEQAVRIYLNRPDGSICVADLLEITSINCAGYAPSKTASLTLIPPEVKFNSQYLMTLTADFTTIEDLKYFRSLTVVGLDLMITSGYDTLAALPLLEEFYAYESGITDISFVSVIKNLKVLSIPNNKVSDISPLLEINLEKLWIEGNELPDYSVLYELDIPFIDYLINQEYRNKNN